MDYRRQIPLSSFLNGAILPRIDDLPEVRAVYADTMRTLGKPSFEYSMMNAGHIAGMLYGLLVVPMKLYESPQDDSLLDAVKAERLSRLFDIVTCDSRFRADPEGELLRHLRNSVSNVNFTISEKNEFEFWDEDPISGSHDWEVRIDREALLAVLSKLGHHFGQAPL